MTHVRSLCSTVRRSHLPSLVGLLALLTTLSQAQIRHLEFDESSGPAVYTDESSRKQARLQPGYSLNAPADTGVVADPQLIGLWEHRGPQGAITLEFISDTRLIFAARHVTYTLAEGTIRVKDDVGHTEYAYRVRGDRLLLLLKDREQKGGEMEFRRVDLDPDPEGPR